MTTETTRLVQPYRAHRTTRPGADPRGVLTAIALGAVAVVGLWWSDTSSVAGLGEWLTNAGRITGLLAGYAVVVLLLLMARIPWLDRGIGSDRLGRWHAMGGRYTVGLVVTHGVLVTWGYAVTAHTSTVTQCKEFLTEDPLVLLAVIGGLLLLGVGITSARVARARLRYEIWHHLHLATYLAVGLAFAHQLSTGAQFGGAPLTRIVWTAMYALMAGLIVWYRVLTPIGQAFRYRLQVLAVVPEAADCVSVYIGGRDLGRLRAEPGQFFRWRFLTERLWWSANPYSLSAAPHPDHLRITVKGVGDHSRCLRGLRTGTRVLAEGPYGALTEHHRARRKVLLLAGGIGITPLRAMIETFDHPTDITLVYRAGAESELVFRDEIDTIAARRGIKVHYVLSDDQPPGAGDPLSAGRLRRLVPDLRQHDVFLCGPPGMIDTVRRSLQYSGVPRAQVHVEKFEL